VIENKARDASLFAKLLKTKRVTHRDASFRKVLTRGFRYWNFPESRVTSVTPPAKLLKNRVGRVTDPNFIRHGPKFFTPVKRCGVPSDGGRSATRGGIGPQG
jgi:hypothetical protein